MRVVEQSPRNLRMNSAEKNPNQNTNEAQTGQGREGVRESQGSVYVSDLRNSQRQHTSRSIGSESQNIQVKSDTKMGRKKHNKSVQGLSPELGYGNNKAYELGYRSSIWRGYIPAIREYGTAVSNIQGDVSGLGRVSIETRGLLQEEVKACTGRGLQSVRLYCKNIYRFWTKNKRGSRMIDKIERAVVFTLLIGLCILTWYVIITIGVNYV